MGFGTKKQVMSARDEVYWKLREQILMLELPPGTPLSENESAARFQVSRTPVRESFMRLAQEGLVQVLPQRGTFVSLIDTALVEEARFMREQLEKAVIRLACMQFPAEAAAKLELNLLEQQRTIAKQDYNAMFELDEAFHRTLFDGCGKSNMWLAMQQLNVHLNRSRMLKLVDDFNWENLYEQHCRMADAVKAKDTAAAEQLMQEHLSLGIADQALLKEKYPHYYK